MYSNLFSQERINKMGIKLNYLGYDATYAELYLLIKSIVLFITFLFLCFINVYTFFFSIPLIIIFNYLYELLAFKIPTRKRIIKLENDAIIYLKALDIAYNANNNLKTALYVTSKNLDNTFSEEIKKALKSVKFGKGLYDSLKELSTKLPSKSLQAIVKSLNEAAQMGAVNHELIIKQVTYLESKQNIRVLEQLRFLPLKILLNSLLFIIPLVLLILKFI